MMPTRLLSDSPLKTVMADLTLILLKSTSSIDNFKVFNTCWSYQCATREYTYFFIKVRWSLSMKKQTNVTLLPDGQLASHPIVFPTDHFQTSHLLMWIVKRFCIQPMTNLSVNNYIAILLWVVVNAVGTKLCNTLQRGHFYAQIKCYVAITERFRALSS